MENTYRMLKTLKYFMSSAYFVHHLSTEFALVYSRVANRVYISNITTHKDIIVVLKLSVCLLQIDCQYAVMKTGFLCVNDEGGIGK